jgi:hypothetical protein
MTEFEHVLGECLRDLDEGVSNVEECLQHYPTFASDLEPILLTSAYIAHGREARLSPAFKARVRTRLIQQMHAHPRKTTRPRFMFMRLAASLAVVVLTLLAAGTAYAQRALPGETFYAWKLASENVWRAVSPDPLGVDLAIAERRMNELMAVREDPSLQAQTLEAYLEVASRLRLQINTTNEERILPVLDSQAEELDQQGILPELPDQIVVPPRTEPSATPATTLVPVLTTPPANPLPNLETPPVNPTELPQIVPTVEVLPEVAPTVEDLPEVVPTVPDLPDVVPTIESLPSLP